MNVKHFMILTDLMEFSGVFGFLPREDASFIKGLLEMTAGCSAAKNRDVVVYHDFGGFSVIGQTMSMLRGTKIRFGEVFKMRLPQGA